MLESVYDLERMLKRRRASKASLFLLLTLAFTLTATAHDFSSSYSRLSAEGPIVRVALTLNLMDMHAGPQVDSDGDGFVSSDELEAVIVEVFEAIREHFQVRAPDVAAESFLDSYDFVADNVARLDMVYRFEHEVTDVKVVSTLDEITQPNHRHLLQIGEGDKARHGVLSAEEPEIDIDYAAGIPFWVTMRDFTELGIGHIFTGYDHLAFLVGLLMATTTLLSLAKVVTSFTVAHSVTLGLATLGLVALPSRLIESLIALSIAYIAIENFTGHTLVDRWKITFLFGLVHGFGFSNVLREMELTRRTLATSLFSFNIGVEIGQLVFVAALFPLLIYLGRTRWKEQVIAAASVAIMSLGFYWFVQRALLA